MSKPSAPAAPDPTAVAAAQEGTNVGTAVAQSNLNNVNQVTPYGSTSWNTSGGYTDPQSGQWVPSYTETSSLSPLAQSALTGTEQVGNYLINGPGGVSPGSSNSGAGGAISGASGLPGGVVGSLTQQAATDAGTPLNFSGANQNTIAGGPQALDQPVAQAAYNASTGFLQPQFQQQQTDLQDQLSRQGISVGNQGYGNAENQLQNTQNNALTTAANNATVTGANQANNMFGLALQGQNQQIAQQQTGQQNPLQLLSMIYGGQSAPGTTGTA